MMLKPLIVPFVIYLCWAKEDLSKKCASKEKCHECISVAGCAWCSQDHVLDSPRCFHPNLNFPYISDVCSEEYVYFAVSSTDYDDTVPEAETPKKILPIKYNLKLRIGEPMYLWIKIRKTAEELNNSSQLEIHHNASQVLKVDFRCLSDDMEPMPKCDSVKETQYVNIKIEALTCPAEQEQWAQNFIVYSSDPTDYVQMNVNLICSCPCEQKGALDYVSKSKKCNSVGTLKCGVCECDLSHIGKNCECTIKEHSNLGCRPPSSGDGEECSGRGSCVCNKCHCTADPKRYSGDWCECDNLSCLRHDGKVCSGNGWCICGKCACRSGWIGAACECSTSVKSCFDSSMPDSGICNNRGNCVCGKCQCDSNDTNKYSGKHCEKCDNCENDCGKLEPCVLCQAYKKGPYSEDDCLTKCKHKVTLLKSAPNTQVYQGLGEFFCDAKFENNCTYKFNYKVVNGTHEIGAEELQC